MLGGEVITIDSNNHCSINPFELVNDNPISIEQIINTMKFVIEVNKLLKAKLTLEDILNAICSRNNIELSKEDKEKVLNHIYY